MMITWQEFLSFADQKSWAWKILLGQEDERKLTGFLGTEVATTSGTSIDFTGIPSWVTQIEINLAGVSTNGTSPLLVQLGDADGVETTGYLGAASNLSSGVTTANYTTGFGLMDSNAATVIVHGTVVLTLEDGADNTWCMTWVSGRSDVASTLVAGGRKALSGALDRVRMTTVGGTDTFDAGVANIRMT